MITEEMKNKNLKLYLNKLDSLGIQVDKFETQINDLLLNATFSMTSENGYACDGSLLHVVLRILTPLAIKINELLPEDVRVNTQSIIKVCLLSHIAKCKMFIVNDNTWEIEKKGLLYKYAPSHGALKLGAKSIVLSQELGVTFTQEEFEAMMVLDKDDNDTQTKYFSSALASIIKQANELTFLYMKLTKLN